MSNEAMYINIALRLLDAGTRLGNEYVKQQLRRKNKTIITEADIEELEIQDPNPGDVFEEKNDE